LNRVAESLQVTIEELLSSRGRPVSSIHAAHFPSGSGPGVSIHKLLPDNIPGMEIERLDLPPAGRCRECHIPRHARVPHLRIGRARTHCGRRALAAGRGDVVAFRGDQPHTYANPDDGPAVGYSVVVLARVTG